MNRRVFGVFASAVLASTLSGCWGPPQMGTDKEAFKAVDALFTATGLRDAGKVDQCMANLKALHEAGKMPESAYKSVVAISADAKAGKWEVALERLSKFMEGQRR